MSDIDPVLIPTPTPEFGELTDDPDLHIETSAELAETILPGVFTREDFQDGLPDGFSARIVSPFDQEYGEEPVEPHQHFERPRFRIRNTTEDGLEITRHTLIDTREDSTSHPYDVRIERVTISPAGALTYETSAGRKKSKEITGSDATEPAEEVYASLIAAVNSEEYTVI